MGDTCEMLRHVLDVLAAFGEGLLAQLLKALLTDPLLATTAPLAEWAQSTPSSRPTLRPTSSGVSDTGPGFSMEDKKDALISQSQKLEN